MGTSRTLVIDPSEHNLLGGLQYLESLPLNDKEVVITFDDGPLPPYSTRILDVLAEECVKATYFLVGRMARAYPRIVQRIHTEGHTLANHSQSHPFNFHRMTVEDAAREIETGFESIAAAVGDPAKVAPFFRFPGLLRQDSVEHYLRSRRIVAWSVDFMADDWTRIDSHEVVKRALERLEAKGKGILLLHDIKPATALALPELLRELKTRGYRVVHVVPATADRPRTATTPEQWVVRQAPSVTSFGAPTVDAPVPVTLVPAPEPLRRGDGEIGLPSPWPEEVITIAAFPAVEDLPAPAAVNFRYQRIMRSRAQRERRRPAPQITHSVNADITGSIGESNGKREPKAAKSGKSAKSLNNKSPDKMQPNTSATPRSADRTKAIDAIGHQILISQPQAKLTPAR